MVLMFALGAILLVFAVVIVAQALRPDGDRGVDRSLAVLEAMTSAPEELTKELDRPFGERVMEPLQARALAIGRRLSGADSADRIRQKLDYAGNPRDWSADRVVSVKVIGAFAMLVIGLALSLTLGLSAGVVVLGAVGGLVLGFFLPDLYLYQAAYNRSERLQRELPDAIDLLTISVESGLGFDAACQQVSRNTEGPLAEEFSRMLREMQIGSSRSEALRGMAERTTVEDVRGFVSAMVQADSFGIPVGQVLRVQSSEMRVKRRQRAETKAQQVPVKITVPLIFCILPCLFIAVMGPAALSIMDNMG
ncbi:type II secretion system F family protein [Nocardioides sp. R-C-SC26]|uniref:type II secretion system F family protein n=1 Tax=Nocardioides sp. R-C-SC26 TaxID=2870414 RepID=UPI001E43CE2B|nr:type II secretion system F family protein [Nocardioides sp. R-C-SC26]